MRFTTNNGRWPRRTDSPIAAMASEIWEAIDHSLEVGGGGLPTGSSLPKLLAEHRDYRNLKAIPLYSVKQILRWADAFHKRHGRCGGVKEGAIEDAPGETETWNAVGSGSARWQARPARWVFALGSPGQTSGNSQPSGLGSVDDTADFEMGRRPS